MAAFGQAAAALEARVHRDSRLVGGAYSGGLVLAVALVAAGAQQRARSRPVAEAVLLAAGTWAVLGGTTLSGEGTAMHALLADGDLAGARRRVTHLCGRDPEQLDAAGLARATVESVAENTSDAVVAPLLWGAVAGLPGLLAYRAVNTLDAMVGHRSPRYARFGWAAARTDDAANLLPARLCAALVVVCAPVVGGQPRSAWRTWRRDGGRHPSPNAGPVEAAFAGALGRTLGGRLAYAGRVEDRPLLGNGPAPTQEDVLRAVRLSRAVSLVTAVLAVGTTAAAGRVRVRRAARRPARQPVRGAARQPVRGAAWQPLRGAAW